MKIEKIYVYPVKSLGAISLETAELENTGFKYDRKWLLLSDKGEVLTQRTIPALSNFKCEFASGGLEVIYDLKQTRIQIPFNKDNRKRFEFQLWDDPVSGFEVAEHISQWFSDLLGQKVYLLVQSIQHPRFVDPRYAKSGNETVSFADGYPILVVSEESLSLLNSKLTKKVEMLRFRPNLVISGLGPHEEDHLGQFKIGEAELMGVKKCARCNMINLDKNLQLFEKEPLQILSSYRRDKNKVFFGQNVLVHKTGILKVGQELEPY